MNSYTKDLLKECWTDIWRYPRLAVVYYGSIYRFLLMRQVLPLVAATAVDAATRGTLGLQWKRLVLYILVAELLSYIGGIAWRKTKDTIGEKASVIRYARHTEEVLNLPYDVLINRSRGDLMSKARAKADFLLKFLNMTFEVPRITINMIVSFVILYNKSRAFAIAYIVLWGPSAYILYRVANSRVNVNKVANQAWDTYSGKIGDVIGNADTVVQFGNQKVEGKQLLHEGKTLWRLYAERWKASRGQVNVIAGTDTIFSIALALFGLYAVTRGTLTIGTYVLLQVYMSAALSDISNIGDIIRSWVEETTRATSLDEISAEVNEISEPTKPVKPRTKDRSIVFEHVDFTYSNTKDSTLVNFNLTIPSGQKVGIVGRSGSGKTTLTKLMLRLYQVHSGSLKLCGVDVEDMGSLVSRSLLAYVPQDPILFHRSIQENITYGKPNASKSEIKEAARLSYSDEFIAELPNSYSTLVGDRGVRLSGGQRQRVAIARAIIKNSPILLFDEATSALDSESEQVIQKALTNLMKNKTAIVIAHRLSTLKHMDRIIVLEKGRIVEDGSHSQLLEARGHYAALWKHQSGGFIEE